MSFLYLNESIIYKKCFLKQSQDSAERTHQIDTRRSKQTDPLPFEDLFDVGVHISPIKLKDSAFYIGNSKCEVTLTSEGKMSMNWIA